MIFDNYNYFANFSDAALVQIYEELHEVRCGKTNGAWPDGKLGEILSELGATGISPLVRTDRELKAEICQRWLATQKSPVTAVDADILQEISRRWRRRDQEDEQVFEWEDTGFANSTGPVYRCGRCHGIHNPDSAAVLMDRQKEKPPFCPLCGAPMKVEERSTTSEKNA